MKLTIGLLIGLLIGAAVTTVAQPVRNDAYVKAQCYILDDKGQLVPLVRIFYNK